MNIMWVFIVYRFLLINCKDRSSSYLQSNLNAAMSVIRSHSD